MGAVSGLAGIISSIGLAAGVLENPSYEDQALILSEFDRLHIETPVAADFAVMNVRIFNSDNELVMNQRSSGEPVDFIVNNGLPDGEYTFEAVSIFTADDLSKGSEIQVGKEEFILRHFGSFTVSGGEIIQRDEPGQAGSDSLLDESSIMDKVVKHSLNLAGLALDVLVPSAQAANVLVQSTQPLVQFDDTDVVGDEWNLWGNSDVLGLADVLGGNNHWVFRFYGLPGSTLNADSMVVDSDGDIHWGANGLNFDHGLSALSLGTAAVRRDVTISSADPAVDLFDESFNDSMGINYDGSAFSIFNNNGADSVRVYWAAPVNSLVVGNSGSVGIGTSSPAARLNVVSDSDAQVLVNNTTVSPPAGDQVMFQLQTAAPNKVRFVIGNAGGLWTFDNAANGFQINRAGTGVNEFRVEPDGDVVILKTSYALSHVNTSSRKSKTDFGPVDEVAVLEKLSELPMNTWRYKKETVDQRHLGPVAEDFQQAFGLGDSEHISTVDASGVALTAIKGLNRVLQDRTTQIEELTRVNAELRETNTELLKANQALDERLTRLELLLLRQEELAFR